ncbi:MAG: hypothetical protein QOE78_1828, partial [Alphaproteobacteria bacterium]|nr:hypothetical protein [Alphaproteobacteria bacterium]
MQSGRQSLAEVVAARIEAEIKTDWRGYKLNRTQTVKTAVLAIAIAAGNVGA